MEVKVQTMKGSDFKQVYAIGAIGGHSPYDFRIAFYNDSPKTLVEDGKSVTVMERKIDTEIILSPLAAKELASWLTEHIKDYEKVFGEVKRPGSKSQDPANAAKSSEPAAIQGYM
jgi:outer membrane lipoprotein-sorting protein